MKKILVTGFNPFNKEKINPSYEAVKLLETEIMGYTINKLELPTEYISSIKILFEEIEKGYDMVFLVGQAGGRNKISLERIAINIRDSKTKDNLGITYDGDSIFEDGDDGYFSNLPLKTIVNNLIEKDIPAYISNTAGAFVCNNILYALMYYIKKNNLNMCGGFIHVPYIPSQVIDKSSPYMELYKIVEALDIIIKTTIQEY